MSRGLTPSAFNPAITWLSDGPPGTRPEIWSWGHRNVQGAAVHPRTGTLWQSEHVADRLRAWPAGQHPIHVEMAPQASDFQRGFRELLVTHLVERGIAVTTEPAALRLRASTQLVQHHAGAASAAPLQRLAEGVYVQRNATYADASVPMRTEVLVVTSLESEGRVLVRTSDVYTIAQPDAPLYQRPAAAPGHLTTWRVVP